MGVTKRQKRGIKERMRAVKEAINAGKSEREVDERVEELTNYLVREGIIQPPGENG